MSIPPEHLVQISRCIHRSLRDVECLSVASDLRVEEVAVAAGHWAVGGGDGYSTETVMEMGSGTV
jgi:hypothetical protein